ncbi:glutamic acid-rich protein isoform X2 [Orussus abietinus]|uniref:glutamic acid-rich protein isoform X2 n=1 Tax=Orussus abietinus TaxID=222816 RepID=UPI0006267C31|nr:glutamic acid-rich protein isoform X2 [Orussus abietinus]
MARGKRPIRGGKRKFDRHDERKQKIKKGKFNLREASYVKERDAKNEEIENRRRRIEEEKARQRRLESESSEEEQEDFTKVLLATLGTSYAKKSAIESESESEEESDDVHTEEVKLADNQNLLREEDNEDSTESTEEEIEMRIKDDNEEDPETAKEDE